MLSAFRKLRLRKIFLQALLACTVGGLIAWLLDASWLRWVDPVIDFGREVYLPWRVLQGEHLGRDFVHPYGPLSVYLNAGLFAAFGVSIRTLVIANLVVFGGIALCLHTVLRRSFGFLPAAVATVVGVSVFGFAHYWGINNYTYAAPYSHEATHGMLVLLLLLVWLGRPGGWLPTRRNGIIVGLLTGLCCLTKTEYVFVSLSLGLIAMARIVADVGLRPGWRTWTGGLLLGSGVILAGTVGWLATVLSLPTAASLALNAMLAPMLYTGYSRSAHVLHFLGADNLWNNLLTILRWGGGTVGCLAILTLVGRRVSSLPGPWPGRLFGTGVLIGALAAIPRIPWIFCGTVFPALLAAGVATLAIRARRRPSDRRALIARDWNQLILLVAAIGMLGRMAFDPTISHYGFFQAILAGTWLCGYLVGEWPQFSGSTRLVRGGLILAMVTLLGGGAITLVRTSLQFYRAKETPIGEGADLIKGFVPQAYALPELWEQARRFILANTKPDSSLLVIPEGISLNYWTRRRHPLRIVDLLPATMRLNPGDIMTELTAAPPDLVVMVSRPNMEELGYQAYGQDASSGKAIVDWVTGHYTIVAQAGSSPFTPGGVGLRIYRRGPPGIGSMSRGAPTSVMPASFR